MNKFWLATISAAMLIVGGCASVPPTPDSGTTESGVDESAVESPETTPTDTTPEVTTTPSETQPEAEESAVKDEVYASAQKPGTEVMLEKLVLAKAGFVVIHKDDNNKPGDGAGASQLLSPGETKDVKVTLTSASKVGEWYWAMLHSDDGDGVYEFPGPDGPLTDSAGNIVMARFEVKE